MEFHSLSLEDVYKELKSSNKGLTSEEAKQRLEEFGSNELQEKEKIKPITIFINQFKSFVIGILIVVVIISLLLKEWPEAIAVFAILILNAFLGFIQEYKAEKAIEALKKLATPKAKVIRNGRDQEIDSREVVPGDILVLATGDKIPADSRIIEQMNLETQEAALTGESVPVQKEVCILNEKTAVANRKNIVYSSTIVTKGRGKAIVIATGMKTEFGKIAELIQVTPEEPTPLQVKLKELAQSLGILTIIICFVIFGVGILKGNEFFEILKTSIALAVAAIPEGLPAVVTISLALGVQRMIRRNALMRKLPSVETLGSTTVICTDKTGTLTHNEMTVVKMYVNNKIVDVSGSGYSTKGGFSSNPKDFEMLLKIGALNNDAKLDSGKIIGDPTEGCLIVSAEKAGLKKEVLEKENQRIDEIPFDSERKLMTTIHNTKQCKIAFTKGAPDIVIEFCNKILIDGRVEMFTNLQKKEISRVEEEFANQALRVLGFAYKEITNEDKKSIEKDMVFVGLQAMIDPPRAEVKDAIAKCKRAGIKVVMVTGDYKGTAQAIAKELGIDGIAITGTELDEIENLEERVEDIGIYARVNPEHKMKIIDAFKKRGHIVAMTGDGVNDAPALKKADIGIAMGITGTDVSREASDMILTDDNFASIVNAVEEGRGIYDNIKKFVKYLLSCNIGEVLTIFIGILLGLPPPLLALQILLMNIVTDGLPALALGIEPIEADIMFRKPRKPKERIFSKSTLINMLIVGIILCIGTLGIFKLYLNSGEVRYAQTMAFTTLVMFQMFNVLNCRSEKRSLFSVGIFSNKYLIGAIASSLIIQLIVIYTPLSVLFDTVKIGLVDWVYIILVSGSILVIIELIKLLTKNDRA